MHQYIFIHKLSWFHCHYSKKKKEVRIHQIHFTFIILLIVIYVLSENVYAESCKINELVQRSRNVIKSFTYYSICNQFIFLFLAHCFSLLLFHSCFFFITQIKDVFNCIEMFHIDLTVNLVVANWCENVFTSTLHEIILKIFDEQFTFHKWELVMCITSLNNKRCKFFAECVYLLIECSYAKRFKIKTNNDTMNF